MRVRSPLAIGAVVASALALSVPAAAQERIVVTSSGGIWLESAKQNFAACFKERTGQEPEIQATASNEIMAKLRASPGKPPIHVAVLSEIDAIRAGREGLLDKLDFAKVPNLNDVPEVFRKQWDGFATIQNFGAMIVMVNGDVVKDPPKDWKALIDQVAAGKYGKRVSFPSLTMPWGPMFTWFLTTLYDGSEDMVFQKYKAMLPNMAKYWVSPVEALNMFAAKEIDVLVYWDGRAYAFAGENPWAKAYIPEPGAFQSAAMLAKPKGAPDLAWQYVDCVLSPKAQLGHSQMVKYPIVNSKVVYPDELKRILTPLEKVRQPDFAKIIDRLPAWLDRWNREIR
ncbi:MAG: extracellular solute-binding protein [Alphaproteobacteria bacterium]|nr:extracellular solute-binding protein [Alphaproteobacteria bacterium]